MAGECPPSTPFPADPNEPIAGHTRPEMAQPVKDKNPSPTSRDHATNPHSKPPWPTVVLTFLRDKSEGSTPTHAGNTMPPNAQSTPNPHPTAQSLPELD